MSFDTPMQNFCGFDTQSLFRNDASSPPGYAMSSVDANHKNMKVLQSQRVSDVGIIPDDFLGTQICDGSNECNSNRSINSSTARLDDNDGNTFLGRIKAVTPNDGKSNSSHIINPDRGRYLNSDSTDVNISLRYRYPSEPAESFGMNGFNFDSDDRMQGASQLRYSTGLDQYTSGFVRPESSQLSDVYISKVYSSIKPNDDSFDFHSSAMDSSYCPISRGVLSGSQPRICTNFDSDMSLFSSSCDHSVNSPVHCDSFLFDSSNIYSATTLPSLGRAPSLPPRSYADQAVSPPMMGNALLKTPPPLPPRSYQTLGRDVYSATDGLFSGISQRAGSGRSSTSSLASPIKTESLAERRLSLPGMWSRNMPSCDIVDADDHDWDKCTLTATRPISSHLTATAAPFVVPMKETSEPSPEAVDAKKESVKDVTLELKEEDPSLEKKKGSGEDVNIEKLRNGEDTRSAVMIRNIPNRFSKEELCQILDPYVEGKYAIMNMPLDSKTHRNLGYSFIQFNSVGDLIHAYECLQGKTWPKSESIKKCRFCYAKIQGDISVTAPQTTETDNSSEIVTETLPA